MDDEVLQMYIDESRDHLADIENDLLFIEQRGANIDVELVNKVFRAAHSLKGGAGFLNLSKIRDLAHKIENVLDMIRSRELVPNAEVVNILLLAFDRLRELINNVGESNQADITEFMVSLTGLASSYLAPEQKETIKNLVPIKLPGGKKVMEVSEFDLAHAGKDGSVIYLIEYDLIHDVHRFGKTPLTIIKIMLGFGAILDCTLDLSAVGTLEDEPSKVISFYVLFATTYDLDVMNTAFDVDIRMIHPFSNGKGVSAGGDARQQPPSQAESPAAVKAAEPPEHREKSSSTDQSETSLRVNVNLLESLMNLAGELVLSRNQLLEAIAKNDERALCSCGQRINLVTSELQETIMITRMQPIGNIFNKFPRVVRSMAMDMGKEIRLDLIGKEVEMDKTIIEGLSDPLTHLVRNAVDHGIETSDIRVKDGKDPLGVIKLKAYHEAGQVIIEVSDDGKGIDPRKIAAAAISRGLVTADQIKVMSEKEVMALIFLPSLSTKDEVSDISGRGVGMDVVKTNLDKLGGQVDITSEIGKGSIFRIKLPLTLAIIPCLLVWVGNERFAIPQINVDELIRIKAGQVKDRIETIGDAEVLILRGKLIPIIHVADVLNIQKTFADPRDGQRKSERRGRIAERRSPASAYFDERVADHKEEGVPKQTANDNDREDADRRYHAAGDLNIVIVTTGIFQYGLVVEALHDSVEIVVKPLGRHLKHIKQYAGATIMGDGRIALILDVSGVAQATGLISFSGTSRAVELTQEQQRDQYEDLQSLLLFRNNPDEPCAIHLDLVDRVEQINKSQIETVGGKRVMQYRGKTMPLFALEDVANVKKLSGKNGQIVIVFHIADREAGLLANSPVDAVEAKFTVDESTVKQPGIMGAAVIQQKTTLIVDIYGIVEHEHPEWLAGISKIHASATHRPNILLAEDSDFFRSHVKKFIEDKGYPVIAAEDGLAAWNLLEKNCDTVKLVVTDIEMPNLDGFALSRKIKEDQRFRNLPIIALTSLAGEDDIARGKSAGIDSYQIKLDKDNLFKAIVQYLP